MPLVTVDCRFGSQHAGLGRFTRSLMRAVLKRDDGLRYALLVRSQDEQWLSALPKGRHELVTADIPHYSIAEHTTLPGIIRAQNPDMHWSMHFTVPYFCPAPFVATIHDLILHRHPNSRSLLRQTAYRMLMQRCVRRATTLLVPTVAVADDIAHTYGDAALIKTAIIGEGVDEEYAPHPADDVARVRAAYGITGTYFLYVGNAKEHKNVRTLITAHEQLGADAPLLVLVSGGREADALPRSARTVLLRDVPDADLPALYTGALCFVTASVDEGFCLPVAEAIACGCPVIAADTPAIIETLRGRGTLIEATVEAFARALRSPPPRPAPERLWSWDDAAKNAVDALRGAIQLPR